MDKLTAHYIARVSQLKLEKTILVARIETLTAQLELAQAQNTDYANRLQVLERHVQNVAGQLAAERGQLATIRAIVGARPGDNLAAMIRRLAADGVAQ